jgi:hypothetical protein
VAVDRARPRGSFFFQGFIVIISNPEDAGAVWRHDPPFITPGADPMQQIFLLGLTFMAIAAIGDTAYALMAGKAGAAIAVTHPDWKSSAAASCRRWPLDGTEEVADGTHRILSALSIPSPTGTSTSSPALRGWWTDWCLASACIMASRR